MNKQVFTAADAGQKLASLNDKYIAYVRDTIDMTVQAGEGEFPVMGQTLVKSSIATRKQLDILEEQGHIRSVTIDVPSVLVPSKTVKEKAYYTERHVPVLCQNSFEVNDKVKFEGIN